MTAGSVLIVDDQKERAQELVNALDGHDFYIEVRPEVVDLETVLGVDSPWDCVITTVDLHGVSWSSVRRSMRGFDVQVPVITFSNEKNFDSMSTALSLGAADFFVRPAKKPGLLVRSVERSVHHRQLQRELKRSKERLERLNAELRHSLRILEQDQQAGRQVQRAMLPAGSLKLEDYWLSHKIVPSLYLSGDFTDYFRVGEHSVVFYLADVSGHGSSSAFATVLLKNLFARKRSDFLRQKDHAITNPVQMLKFANRELLELAVSKYATMVVGVLDTDKGLLRYSVAGHLPLPVLISDKETVYLPGEGSPVGLIPDPVYEEHAVELPDHCILTIMSDGVLETMNDSDLIGKEAELLKRLTGAVCKPSEVVARLGLEDLGKVELPDDIAGLFLSRGLS
ncbi:response regulator receiver (CheY) modulated Serine phosphatase [Luminiphilus syltensis NOR5-1B]|uniref:Response regulator receiver (CheY) modulated Serine phosphatase n=1 Tax=Luminiphilus syltensis NOR5-1B TaxID=565045 RepID=B8KXL9_9GAMM|nr:SpoIIE family protein phosphatase [Luminiphilus syltensis]EED36737.1 response regulator receiver (CheY) modulated Serine phosphatase [Luminiphilus syltensis NOR5-1B]